MKKYKTIDIPMQTWEEFKKSQIKMGEAYKKLTGKDKNIPLTKVIEVKAKQPTYLFDGELVGLFKKGRKKI